MVTSENWSKLPVERALSAAKRKEGDNSSVPKNLSSLEIHVVNKASPENEAAGSSGERTVLLKGRVVNTTYDITPSGCMLRSGTAMHSTRRSSRKAEPNGEEKGKLVQRLLGNDRRAEDDPSTSSADIICKRDDHQKI